MEPKKVRIGELLVDAGILTEEKLKEALELQKDSGQRLGSVLIQRQFVTEPQLIQALSKQLSIPWVSLWHLDISEQLLDMIPEELVVENGVIPIYIRSMRGGGKALYVAMDNPADDELLETISEACDMAVKPMIAGPSEIGSAIHNYYGRRWKGAPMPAERRVSSVPPPPPSSSVEEPQEPEEVEDEILLDEVAEEEPAEEATPEPAPDADQPEEDEEGGPAEDEDEEQETIELTEPARDEDEEDEEPHAPAPGEDLFAPKKDAPAPSRGRKFKRWRPQKLNLTFLDGTSVALGADREKKAREAERTTEQLLEEIGSLSLEGEQGRRLALIVRGILKTLLRRGMLTDAELKEMLDDH